MAKSSPKLALFFIVLVLASYVVMGIEAEPARCKYTIWDGLRQVFRDMADRAKGINDRTYVNPDACVEET
ncbi:hypothetical protein V6N12_006052 [Hibiscus sabdariffa]|uniref:Uncharacterized protein n=1 Tax=Hibiscus sabdariffa TaxID=183260 RepID=A0ABR2EWV7_9ROSI